MKVETSAVDSSHVLPSAYFRRACCCQRQWLKMTLFTNSFSRSFERRWTAFSTNWELLLPMPLYLVTRKSGTSPTLKYGMDGWNVVPFMRFARILFYALLFSIYHPCRLLILYPMWVDDPRIDLDTNYKYLVNRPATHNKYLMNTNRKWFIESLLLCYLLL